MGIGLGDPQTDFWCNGGEVKEQIEKVNGVLVKQRQTVTEAKGVVSSHSEAKVRAEKTLAEVAENTKAIDIKIGSVNDQTAEVSTEIESLRKRLAELEAQRRELLSSKKSLESEKAEQGNIANDIKAQIVKTSGSLGQSETHLKEEQSRAQEISKELQEWQGMFSSCDGLLGKLGSKTPVLRQNFEAAWRIWKPHNVANWLCRIHSGVFSKYKATIEKEVAERGIDGECLPQVKDPAWFGIKNFKEGLKVLAAIEKLTVGSGGTPSSPGASDGPWRSLLVKWELAECIPMFEKQKLTDTNVWTELEADDLKSIGMVLGDRKKFLRKVAEGGTQQEGC